MVGVKRVGATIIGAGDAERLGSCRGVTVGSCTARYLGSSRITVACADAGNADNGSFICGTLEGTKFADVTYIKRSGHFMSNNWDRVLTLHPTLRGVTGSEIRTKSRARTSEAVATRRLVERDRVAPRPAQHQPREGHRRHRAEDDRRGEAATPVGPTGTPARRDEVRDEASPRDDVHPRRGPKHDRIRLGHRG